MKKRFIFLANVKWGPNLNKLEVIKETPKTFKIGEEINILGSKEWKSRILKDTERYFDDPVEAIEYLIVQQAEVIKQCEIKLDDAHSDQELLEELLKELEKGDSDVVDIVSKALHPDVI